MIQEIKHPDRQNTGNSPFSAAIECDGWLYVRGQIFCSKGRRITLNRFASRRDYKPC